MVTGRVIIATEARGWRGWFLVLVGVVEALVTAMEKYFPHPEMMEQMGNQSRRIVNDK